MKIVNGLRCASAKSSLNKCEVNLFHTLVCEIWAHHTKTFILTGLHPHWMLDLVASQRQQQNASDYRDP